MSEVPEALLEMHYFEAMKQCFQSIFGLDFLRLLKPSQQNEGWVGFDQGWASTTVSSAQLYTELKDAIASPGTSTTLFLAYFLQFKVVQIMSRAIKEPVRIDSPYYRIELSLKAKKRTGRSQHETLVRLSAIDGALVYYACPMIFSIEEVLAPANLDLLQCVDISGAPKDWITNQPHSLAFREVDDQTPFWCSEPVPGEATPFPKWARERLHPVDANTVSTLILNATRLLMTESHAEEALFVQHAPRVLPTSLHLISFGKPGDERKQEE